MKVDKKRFYQRKDVVKKYNKNRYGGKSGRMVLENELGTLKQLFPEKEKQKVLDIPVGTGRLINVLPNTWEVIGADASEEMMSMIESDRYQNLTVALAEDTGFEDNQFDIVISLRFFFHFDNIEPFIEEFKRITKPGGQIIFETHNWSPRAIFPKLWTRLGGEIFIHSRKAIKNLVMHNGLELIESKSCFLFSPLAYKYLPAIVVSFLVFLEKITPDSLKTVTYWKVRKN